MQVAARNRHATSSSLLSHEEIRDRLRCVLSIYNAGVTRSEASLHFANSDRERFCWFEATKEKAIYTVGNLVVWYTEEETTRREGERERAILEANNTMAMMSRARLALQIIAAALLLSAVLGAAARPLDGVGDGPLSGGGGGGVASIVDALRRLYLQQLGGPGASCETNSPNNGCPP
ncbi:hypothetical protein PR202_ga17565 [Eleusine coracana subsp. coracana]|uniref:Uncharacterized protein n=1 Tax=Eleusine coracana subsp. coracana TaxID=191504 RepID=A0AAV5CQB4_ELECO|nr:hypothetical protein PR202_ga17318 [Eleusine coracana subsp. coracana]GJN00386.1 hypothetical protein PR202_ga17565 [Eleusine coracana subsp. coracana]